MKEVSDLYLGWKFIEFIRVAKSKKKLKEFVQAVEKRLNGISVVTSIMTSVGLQMCFIDTDHANFCFSYV